MRIYSLTPYDEIARTLEATLVRSLKPHTAPVVTTAVDPTGTFLATGAADGSIKVWNVKGGYVTQTYHGHGGVISALCFFEVPTGEVEPKPTSKKGKNKRKSGHVEDEEMEDMDSIPLDSTLDSTGALRLASGSEEGKVRVWDLNKRKPIASLDSHVSVVRDLSYSPSENALLSASRDKTVIVWDVRMWKTRRIIPVLESAEAAAFVADSALCMVGGENGKLRVFDCNRGGEVTEEQEPGVESDAIVAMQYSSGIPFAMTVHADQTLRLHSLEPLSDFKPGSSLGPLTIVRRISGNDDEIIDLAYVGPDRSMLALATNTESIRVVSIGPSPDRPSYQGEDFFGADVTYLEDHDDIIICLDVDWSGHWLVTGAKDNSARLWRLDPKTSSYTCFATLTGHAESLGAVSLPRVPPPFNTPAYNDPLNHPPAFVLTGSQDRTIKRWDTAKLTTKTSKPHSPKAIFTRKAHEKDINAIDVNSQSTLFASASQDRTVKIWSIEDGSVVGILRGHKRGVWSVRFSPRDTPVISSESRSSTNRGMIVTGSGDKTVKLWSLSDFTCLLTFEGHTNSVLKVLWLPPPDLSKQSNSDEADETGATPHNAALQTRPQIASAAADGLVKIWSPYTGELGTTLDNHTDRVWALASPTPSGSRGDVKSSQSSHPTTSPYSLISGSADSTVTFWTDTTSATYTATVNANSARIEQDQQLQNYIHAGAYREAITLALQLNHPGRLLSLFTSAIDAADSARSSEEATQEKNATETETLTGDQSIDHVLQTLDPENLSTLLLRLRDWNTNARTSRIAQRLLFALFRSYPASTFVELATSTMAKRGPAAAGMKDVLQALAAYTERHYRRIEELADESYLVEWVLEEMDGGVALGGLMDEGMVNGEEDVLMLGT